MRYILFYMLHEEFSLGKILSWISIAYNNFILLGITQLIIKIYNQKLLLKADLKSFCMYMLTNDAIHKIFYAQHMIAHINNAYHFHHIRSSVTSFECNISVNYLSYAIICIRILFYYPCKQMNCPNCTNSMYIEVQSFCVGTSLTYSARNNLIGCLYSSYRERYIHTD